MAKSKSIQKHAAITITADERRLRAMVRSSIRAGIAITRHEEQVIEDEFIRLATKQKQQSNGPKSAEVSHG